MDTGKHPQRPEKVLIVGMGFVGNATDRLLTKHTSLTNADVYYHDPALGLEISEDTEFDYVFICVPTNSKPGDMGELDISIVESVYNKFKGTQVIRSTIGPDHVEHFPEAIIFPEFLREKHWMADVDDDELPLILGADASNKFSQSLIKWFDDETKKNVIDVNPKVAAMIKVSRNAALAVKVEFANILYDTCQAWDVDYDSVSSILMQDKNIGGSHYQVPGPDGKRGFGGKCLPKDTMHFNQLNSSAVISMVLMSNGRRR